MKKYSMMPEHEDMVDSIMKKRRKKFAEGGEVVDLEENSKEMPNEFDDLNMDAAGKELYDDSQFSPQPEDSNLMGDDIDSDEHDMVEAIRKKMKYKREI